MKRIILLAGAVAIAGCASPTMMDMRSQGAAATYTSTREEASVAKCILFAWQDMTLAGAPVMASMQPGRDGGFTVVAHGSDYFADIKASPEGAVVDYYHISNSWISKRLKLPLQQCL